MEERGERGWQAGGGVMCIGNGKSDFDLQANMENYTEGELEEV